MTWAQTLNSSNAGQQISNSMGNIQLNRNVSPAEIQAKINKNFNVRPNYSYQAANPYMQAGQQAQFQPYTAAPQYQPAQYSQAQYYQPQTPAYGCQNVQTQYQAPACYSYPPVQMQMPNYTYGTPMATSNAVNAYSYQAQAPVLSGQNLNVTSNSQPVQNAGVNNQQVQMPTPNIQ